MKLSAAKFFWVSFGLLMGLLVVSCSGLGTSQYAIGMLLPTTVIGGLFACAVVGLFSCRLKRPFGLVDGIRSAGWILIGCSVGCRSMAGSYYRVFWPQYTSVALYAAAGGILGGLLMVLIASLSIAPPEPLRPGQCNQCGYDLTGNVSGVCPECGGRIEGGFGES